MSQEDAGRGLYPALNQALRAISEGIAAPWALLRPGERVLPIVQSSDEDDFRSQAPTRERTPAPSARESSPAPPGPARDGTPAPPEERRQTPAAKGVRRLTPIPENSEQESKPSRKRKNRDRAQEPREPPPDWRRPLRMPGAGPESEIKERSDSIARDNISDATWKLVLRARSWRARGLPAPSRITPASYDAVDVEGRFGLIECTPDGPRPLPGAGQTLLLAHAPPRRDPLALQALRPGDTVRVLSTRDSATPVGVTLRVQFVTRAGYIAPGRKVSLMALGVATAEWARAHQPRDGARI